MIEENVKLKSLIFEHFLKGTQLSMNEEVSFIDSPLLRICLSELYMGTQAFFQKQAYKTFNFLDYSDADQKAFDREHIQFLRS